MQLNQFERPERLIGYVNYEQFFHMVLMAGSGMNLKLIINVFNVAAKFSSLPRKHSPADSGKNQKVVPRL